MNIDRKEVMSVIVKIPESAESCVEQLVEAGALITAKEWQRAAIVAALVGSENQQGHRSDLTSTSSSGSLTLEALKAHQIVGLRSVDTIRRYRDAWCKFRPVPTLGEQIDLEGLPDFPPTTDYTRNVRDPERIEALVRQADEDAVGRNMTIKIAGSPKALAAAIKADAETARIAAEALRERARRYDHAPAAPEPRDTVVGLLGALANVETLLRMFVERLNRFEGRLDIDAAQAARDGLDDIDVAIGWARTLLDENTPMTDEALHAWLGSAS